MPNDPYDYCLGFFPWRVNPPGNLRIHFDSESPGSRRIMTGKQIFSTASFPLLIPVIKEILPSGRADPQHLPMIWLDAIDLERALLPPHHPSKADHCETVHTSLPKYSEILDSSRDFKRIKETRVPYSSQIEINSSLSIPTHESIEKGCQWQIREKARPTRIDISVRLLSK